MAATQTITFILGTFGEFFTSAPILDTDGTTPKDFSSHTVTATFYPPSAQISAPFDRTAEGLATGVLRYQVKDGDITATGIWEVRLFAELGLERISSERFKVYVIEPQQDREGVTA